VVISVIYPFTSFYGSFCIVHDSGCGCMKNVYYLYVLLAVNALSVSMVVTTCWLRAAVQIKRARLPGLGDRRCMKHHAHRPKSDSLVTKHQNQGNVLAK
jgi:hypothetical protein